MPSIHLKAKDGHNISGYIIHSARIHVCVCTGGFAMYKPHVNCGFMTSHKLDKNMAVNFEPGVSLQTPSEIDSLLAPNEDATTITSSFPCKLRYRARRVRSKGAVLVLVWTFLAFCCPLIVATLFQSVVHMPFWFGVLQGVIVAVLYLVAGWLADVYFGRYKVIEPLFC